MVELPPINRPNADGSATVVIRWIVETPDGWIGAWDRAAIESYARQAVAAEREACAALIECQPFIEWHAGLPPPYPRSDINKAAAAIHARGKDAAINATKEPK